MMEMSQIFNMFVLTISMIVISDGQINRYINPVWLEMDANSEYYPGGEVISQILQAYGLTDSYGSSRYRSSVSNQNSYGKSNTRNRVLNNLNNAYYDSDPSTQEYLDRNYDYVDNAIRGSSRYRNNMFDIPRSARINVATTVPKTTYYQPEYLDQHLPSTPLPLSYSRFRLLPTAGDSTVSQDLVLRSRETPRLIPRSTVTPDTANENRKI
ncbi:Hypothetical protein CINCED_3A013195 [Cinara cedri]|uniref:Uncharacterized protein n=1 Tax=Cinara cedri TaxID=506608 RepID=A0A5E4MH23_9HEMI|nr:Hypothetical protein CINCED_3A013195 [Cinara cedri]